MLNLVSRLANARILVVDDGLFDQQLISVALRKAGFEKIILASNGLEAVDMTYEQRPDLVLLDLEMPQLDGFGYCERVRNASTLPRMPIIVQTAKDDRKSLLRALSCGADDYLVKPLDMAELTLRMRIHAERFFMIQDMEAMCGYLKMELEVMNNMQGSIGNSAQCDAHRCIVEKHCEVLQQMAHSVTIPG